MTHWRKLGDFNADRIGAWDLGDRDWILEIVDVRSEKLAGTREIKANRRPVLSFRGAKKTLIVNATIGKTISSLYGSDIEAWKGKRIALYATTTPSKKGEIVECVRVRNKRPDGPAEDKFDGQPVDEEMRARQKRGAGEDDGLVHREGAEASRIREPGEEG